jgi:hypothetical protein
MEMTPADDALLRVLDTQAPGTMARIDEAITTSGHLPEDIVRCLCGLRHDPDRGAYVRMMFGFRDGRWLLVDSIEIANLLVPAGGVN